MPRNLTFLRQHLEMNGAINCSMMEVAVSCSDGTATFEMGPNPSTGHLTSDSQDKLSVRTIALDRLIALGQIPPPNVIKCDIEGGEYEALRGATEILSRYAPTIFLATHGPEVHEQCCTLLTDLHYQLTPLDDHPLSLTSEVLATRRRQ